MCVIVRDELNNLLYMRHSGVGGSYNRGTGVLGATGAKEVSSTWAPSKRVADVVDDGEAAVWGDIGDESAVGEIGSLCDVGDIGRWSEPDGCLTWVSMPTMSGGVGRIDSFREPRHERQHAMLRTCSVR